MFVVEMGFVIALLLSIIPTLFGDVSGDLRTYNLIVAIILLVTVLFANFAESVAEGRGKAQAASLKKTQKDTEAHLLHEDGSETIVASSQLKKGDVVMVVAAAFHYGDTLEAYYDGSRLVLASYVGAWSDPSVELAVCGKEGLLYAARLQHSQAAEPAAEMEQLNGDDLVERAFYAQTLGYAAVDSENEYKPYLYVLGADEAFFEQMPRSSRSGSHPGRKGTARRYTASSGNYAFPWFLPPSGTACPPASPPAPAASPGKGRCSARRPPPQRSVPPSRTAADPPGCPAEWTA